MSENKSTSTTTIVVKESPQKKEENKKNEAETTDTPVRYLAYFARLRGLVAVNAAAASGIARYLAYTSDVGEAFRPVVPVTIVRSAYAISWAYVGFDVGNEAYKDYKLGRDNTEISRTILSRSIFQSVASMALPAFTIHQTVHFTHKYIFKTGRFQKWGPTVAGLLVVPFLPYMFDHPVEWAVEKVFNTLWPSKYPQHHTHGHPLQHGSSHQSEEKKHK